MISKAFSFVDNNLTLGAQPSSSASNHREAHKHQPSPGLRPGKSYSGLGVVKSLPLDLENSKNSFVKFVGLGPLL